MKALTEVELEMMHVIWRKGPCSVAHILDSLSEDRQLAYTSVSTIVRILEQKKFVKSQKEGRGHLYSAILSKEDYQAHITDHFVRNIFDGAPSSLVKHLVQSESLTRSEIQDLKTLLEKREQGV